MFYERHFTVGECKAFTAVFGVQTNSTMDILSALILITRNFAHSSAFNLV